MSIQIRTPAITGGTDREKLQQIQSYLYQMAQQLQWAFDSISGGGAGQTLLYTGNRGGKTPQTEDSSDSFARMKDLIIKSADIVNAYYSVISRRLEGIYLAQSEFGTYREETAQEIRENSTGVSQLFTSLREVSGTVDELYDSIFGTNAYLKSGLLGETSNGMPVYGLEIGQTNSINGQNVFDKFARFTADRLSFYDRNDVEVAYVSDYKLYITNAEITGNLYLTGKFRIFYKSGLAFQWTGGD